MIITLSERDTITLKEYVGDGIIAHLDENRSFFTAIGENMYFLTFYWMDGKKVTVFASMEQFILATDSNAVRSFAEKVDVVESGILQFHEFLLEMTASDVHKLESLENLIISLEDKLLMDRSPGRDGLADIVKVRKDMIRIKRYYEQMEFLSDELSAIDPSFSFIDQKFHRLLQFVIHLQQYIESVRDAYQSQIDIEQNNIMKVFTVVTSIFLPLSLVAAWYGMNFQQPEYSWKWGYPFVVGLSLGIVILLLVIFKKKKWF